MRGLDKLGGVALLLLLAYLIVQFLATQRDKLSPDGVDAKAPYPVRAAFERAFPRNRVDAVTPMAMPADAKFAHYRFDFVGRDDVNRYAIVREDGEILLVAEAAKQEAADPPKKSGSSPKKPAPAKKWED